MPVASGLGDRLREPPVWLPGTGLPPRLPARLPGGARVDAACSPTPNLPGSGLAERTTFSSVPTCAGNVSVGLVLFVCSSATSGPSDVGGNGTGLALAGGDRLAWLASIMDARLFPAHRLAIFVADTEPSSMG